MSGDHIVAPVLATVTGGLAVKRPEGELASPIIGPLGGVSIGGGHLPGTQGVIYIAVHHPDGDTLVLMLGAESFRTFATRMNDVATQLMAGGFAVPETRQ